MTDEAGTDRLRLAEALIGHEFRKRALLQQALTHRSAASGRARRRGEGSNERLEFLGDRVLGLVVAEWLIERFPDEQEGALGLRFADLVSRDALIAVAEDIGLGQAILLGDASAELSASNILADALEAALGALYLDAGLDAAQRFIRRAWEARLSARAHPPEDPKTSLQVWLQGRGKKLPVYEVVSAEGPSHAPRFVVSVSGGGKQGVGEGTTKRAAEREAARALLEQLR